MISSRSAMVNADRLFVFLPIQYDRPFFLPWLFTHDSPCCCLFCLAMFQQTRIHHGKSMTITPLPLIFTIMAADLPFKKWMVYWHGYGSKTSWLSPTDGCHPQTAISAPLAHHWAPIDMNDSWPLSEAGLWAMGILYAWCTIINQTVFFPWVFDIIPHQIDGQLLDPEPYDTACWQSHSSLPAFLLLLLGLTFNNSSTLSGDLADPQSTLGNRFKEAVQSIVKTR